MHSSGIYLANKTIWPLSLMLEKCLDRLQSKTCAVHGGFIVLLWDLIYHLWTLPTVVVYLQNDVKGTFIKYFLKILYFRESKKTRQFFTKVNSVQEAFAKFFAVHTLKFKILQPEWKNDTKIIKKLNLLIKNWKLRVWCSFICYFMGFAGYQILMCESHSIWRKLLSLSWL